MYVDAARAGVVPESRPRPGRVVGADDIEMDRQARPIVGAGRPNRSRLGAVCRTAVERRRHPNGGQAVRSEGSTRRRRLRHDSVRPFVVVNTGVIGVIGIGRATFGRLSWRP